MIDALGSGEEDSEAAESKSGKDLAAIEDGDANALLALLNALIELMGETGENAEGEESGTGRYSGNSGRGCKVKALIWKAFYRS